MPLLATEFRQAVRRLVRTPIFTLAAVLTLTLALGATATIFAVVHRVVLNPLAYPDSDRLVSLDHMSGVINVPSGIGMTSGLYYQYTRARAFDSLAIVRDTESTIVSGGRPERIQIERATATLPQVLRVGPAIGRWFSDREAAPGGPAVAVLSHGLWMRRFGADPAILGRGIVLDGVATEVIGIMPQSFAFHDPRIEAWIPARVSPAMGFAVPFGYDGVARLRRGATIDSARAELNGLIADLPNVYRGDQTVLANVGRNGLRSVAVPLKDVTLGSIARSLWILLAAMGLLLAVACANIANLFLVRATARDREVAVRRAAGAGAGRIAGMFFAESTLLAATGAVGGLTIAWGALQGLVAYGPAVLPRLHEIRLDGATVVFTFALSLIVAVACGTIPLRRVGSLIDGLREAGRGQTTTRQRHRTRQLLMAGQVATVLMLLVAAGLMLQSVRRLRLLDLGFDPASTLTFRVGLPERDYSSRAAAVAAHRAILDRLADLPGVEAVSASTGVPLADACFGNTIRIRARAVVDAAPDFGRLCAVSEGFVSALRMRLVAGRDLDRADVDDGRPNVLVNQAFVNAVMRGQDPIGQQIRSNAPPPPGARRVNGTFEWDGAPPWLTIVGVVSDTPNRTLTEPTHPPVIYMPMSLAGGADIPAIAMLGPSISAMTYVIRSHAPGALLTGSVYRGVETVDRSLALAQVRTLQQVVDSASAQMVFTMTLLLIAAAVALAIGLVGIYGVVSYVVSQRRSEIGVRLALGAAPRRMVAMIVRQGAAVALAGIVAGAGAAFVGSGALRSILYEVSPRDPMVFAVVSGLLFAIALLACWLPARRAAAVSPTEALRAD